MITYAYVYGTGGREDGYAFAVGVRHADGALDGGYALFKGRNAAITFAYAIKQRDGADVAILPSAEVKA